MKERVSSWPVIVFFVLTCLVVCFGQYKVSFSNPVPHASVECLMSNEVDPDSITGSHLVVKVIEDAPNYYVTGYAWDHLQKEWVELDYRVIDKKRAPEYVTPVKCPAPYTLTENE